MEWIGDIERAIATNLYPLRVPIAIGLTIGLAVLVVVAQRRGWLAAARRHRGRTAILALALLVVGLPTAWYLGSPLFIRTSLVEAAPTTAPTVAASAAPSGVPATAAPTTAASAQPTSAPRTPAPERSGKFTGADDFHFGRGTARLIESAPDTWIVRFEDFSVRNGPDLYVYLSPDPEGYAKGALELGTLKATDGSFNYEVPAGTDVSALRSVVIWCKQFAVAPLG